MFVFFRILTLHGFVGRYERLGEATVFIFRAGTNFEENVLTSERLTNREWSNLHEEELGVIFYKCQACWVT